MGFSSWNCVLFVLVLSLGIFWLSVMMAPFDRVWAQLKFCFWSWNKMSKKYKDCDWSRRLQGVPGPPGPKCPKSLKKVFPGPSAPERQKSAEKVRKVSQESLKSLSRVSLWHFFGTFLALRADRPETTFLRLFWHFGSGGPGTPCNWSLQSQYKDVNKGGSVWCSC